MGVVPDNEHYNHYNHLQHYHPTDHEKAEQQFRSVKGTDQEQLAETLGYSVLSSRLGSIKILVRIITTLLPLWVLSFNCVRVA